MVEPPELPLDRTALVVPLGHYKVHAAVITVTGLSLAWHVETAKDSEVPMVSVLLDSVMERGFAASVAILDQGYDTESL